MVTTEYNLRTDEGNDAIIQTQYIKQVAETTQKNLKPKKIIKQQPFINIRRNQSELPQNVGFMFGRG